MPSLESCETAPSALPAANRAAGLFVAIVGPSGAGKDTLIGRLRERLGEPDGFHYVRRVVTRRADAFEDHETLEEAEFLRARDAGRFALAWPAHGLYYGVPGHVDGWIERGGIVVCNISRAVVADLRRRYASSFVVLVTARPETLAARLAARGREGEEGRRQRLDRSASPAVAFEADAVVHNDGDVEEAAARLRDLILARRSGSRA